MIELKTLIAWLCFANGVCVVLALLALSRIESKPLRWSFLAVILTGMLYINPLLLFWLPDLETWMMELFSRFVFTGVLLLCIAFVLFIAIFCQLSSEIRRARFWIFQATVAGLLVLIWTGFLPEAIKIGPTGERSLIHGFAHALFVAATPLYVVYMGFLAWSGYQRTQEEVLQFQIKTLLGAGVLTGCAMVITNAILPFLIGRSIFAHIASLELMVFWAISLFILVQGEVLLARQAYNSLIAKPFMRELAALLGLRTYLYVFEQAVEIGRPFEEQINFKVGGGRDVVIRVANGAGKPDEPVDMVPVGWFEGQADEIARLRKENARLTLEIERGRSLIRSIEAGRGARPELPAPAAADEEAEPSGLTPLEAAEKGTIVRALEKNAYNQARTSKELGIRPNTLIVKMRKYGIQRPVTR